MELKELSAYKMSEDDVLFTVDSCWSRISEIVYANVGDEHTTFMWQRYELDRWHSTRDNDYLVAKLFDLSLTKEICGMYSGTRNNCALLLLKDCEGNTTNITEKVIKSILKKTKSKKETRPAILPYR